MDGLTKADNRELRQLGVRVWDAAQTLKILDVQFITWRAGSPVSPE